MAVFDRSGKVIATSNADIGNAIARSALKGEKAAEISMSPSIRAATNGGSATPP